MTLKKKYMCVCVREARLARRSEKFAVKSWRGWLCVPLPSSSSCRFARSLKSFQPTNPASFHASARIHIHGKKCFADHESFRWWWLEKTGEEKKNDGTRDENGEESREQRSKTSRCVLFHRQSTVARSLSPPFQRFSSIFFALDMPFVRVDRYTCKNFPDSFSPPLFSFFFFHILDLDGLLRCFFSDRKILSLSHFILISNVGEILEKCGS